MSKEVYSVGGVHDCQGFLPRREELGFSSVELELLGFIGNLHSRPPKILVFQLEQKSSITDIKIGNLEFLIPFPNNLSNKVDSLIHLHANLGLDPHLPELIGPPSIESPVIHKRNRIGLAALHLLHLDILDFRKILKVFVQMRQIIVLIVAIPENSVLPVSPVVHLILLVENDAEIPPGSNPLHDVAVERLHLRGLRDDLGNVRAVASRTSWIHKQPHQKIHIPASISEGVNVSLL